MRRSKSSKPAKTIRDLVVEYFMRHPYQDLGHGPVVDWVTEQWLRQGNPTPPRDPWRVIRRLHQEGWLIKVKKGIYRYEPEAALQSSLDDFTPEQKQMILERDNYRCVICGRGREEGFELHVDHIKPRHLGGKSVIENGQTFCSQCNYRKKTYQQTETGKRMFIRLLEIAMREGDEKIVNFCLEILKIYKKYQINDHIKWDE